MTTEFRTCIKQVVIPHLRKIGFKGSYPHLYRVRDSHVDLLTIQSLHQGTAVICELSYSDSNWANVDWREGESEKTIVISINSITTLKRNQFDPRQVRVFMTRKRHRLTYETESGMDDIWCPDGCGMREDIDPGTLARSLKAAIDQQAEPWWRSLYTGSD